MGIVKLYLRSDWTNKEGKSPIQLHVHLHSKKIPLPTGVHVDPKNWSKEKNRIKGKDAREASLLHYSYYPAT